MRRDEAPIEEVIREAFSNAYPNPQRIGCPGTDALKGVAESSTHSGMVGLSAHMSHCSPCTREFLEFKGAWRKRQSQRRLAVTVGLGVVAVSVLLWLFLPISSHRRLPIGGDQPIAAPLVSVLDYHEVKLRGSEHLKPQTVDAKTQELRIAIPRGSETGPYTVAIQRPSHIGEDLAVFSGEAATGADEVVTVRAKVDLSQFAAGEYVAVWRHRGTENYGTFLIAH
jgi:hypothetical protein